MHRKAASRGSSGLQAHELHTCNHTRAHTPHVHVHTLVSTHTLVHHTLTPARTHPHTFVQTPHARTYPRAHARIHTRCPRPHVHTCACTPIHLNSVTIYTDTCVCTLPRTGVHIPHTRTLTKPHPCTHALILCGHTHMYTHTQLPCAHAPSVMHTHPGYEGRTEAVHGHLHPGRMRQTLEAEGTPPGQPLTPCSPGNSLNNKGAS